MGKQEQEQMSYKDNISRLSRLTSILLKLQTKPFVSVQLLAEQYQVTKRTIYRDIVSLEQSGIPIITIEGKGYSIMNGYNVPPVMFTESEANALIVAEKMIGQTKDDSLIKEFNKATDKIKSVLRNSSKEKADFLSNRTIIGKNWDNKITSSYLSDIQNSLTSFSLIQILYKKSGADESTERIIEPFAIYHNTSDNWVLIAWCRLRDEFRNFRIDRIEKLVNLEQKFDPHKISLEEYVESQRKEHFTKSMT